jgi:hypothetical protein
MSTVGVRFQWRRQSAAAWTAANPTLLPGEPGLETDTGLFKVGDGSTAWADLPYGGGGDAIAAGEITPATGTVDLTGAAGQVLAIDNLGNIAFADAANKFLVFQDDADYSTAAFEIDTGIEESGPANGRLRIFTGAFANKINFPVDIIADAYGWIENLSGAAMVLTSPVGVTINDVDNAEIPIFGLAKWVRVAPNTIRVSGAIRDDVLVDGTVSGHQGRKHNNLTGAQTLSKANFRAGAVLVHSGSAATYTLPSRVTVNDRTEALVIRNRGSGDITLSASGPTLVGNTIVEPTQSVVVEWEYDGATERVWVDGATAAP